VMTVALRLYAGENAGTDLISDVAPFGA
jgi:hypothetical protein